MQPNQKRPFDPYKAVKKNALRYDPEKKLKGFESDATALSRNEELIRALDKRDDGGCLASRLRACTPRHRRDPATCLSPACNNCGKEYRRWYTDAAVGLAQKARERTGDFGVVVSVIAAGLTAPIGELGNVNLTEARHLWWEGLHQLAPTYGSIGGIDVSFNESASSRELGYFQVHFASALLGHDSAEPAREALNKKVKAVFELEPTALVPVKVTPLRAPMEQLSYLHKSLFSRRVEIIDWRDRRNTLDLPLKPAQAAEIAIWLDKFSMSDRLLLHGLRRRGAKIVETAARMTTKSNTRRKGSTVPVEG